MKHRFGKCSIKMYDKCGIVLRIETTANDVSFIKHHRKVEHRNGPPTRGIAPVKKTCVSAWKKDPVGGVIGVQKGPLW